MNISDADLKILWGKAAGRCSFPECSNNCIEYFEKSGDTILGAVAHVIARSSDGPCGIPGTTGPNTYDNLILFCPCHHTIVDKVPNDFPENRLRQWKNEHEFRIEQALMGIQFSNAK